MPSHSPSAPKAWSSTPATSSAKVASNVPLAPPTVNARAMMCPSWISRIWDVVFKQWSVDSGQWIRRKQGSGVSRPRERVALNRPVSGSLSTTDDCSKDRAVRNTRRRPRSDENRPWSTYVARCDRRRDRTNERDGIRHMPSVAHGLTGRRVPITQEHPMSRRGVPGGGLGRESVDRQHSPQSRDDEANIVGDFSASANR